jgi:hypothetical protein
MSLRIECSGSYRWKSFRIVAPQGGDHGGVEGPLGHVSPLSIIWAKKRDLCQYWQRSLFAIVENALKSLD